MAGLLTPIVKAPSPIGNSGLMSYNLNMNGFTLTGLIAPVVSSDAARKVDTEGITIPVLNAVGGTVNVSLSK